MNTLLGGIICREPADAELQSSRLQTKKLGKHDVRGGGGGGGGGGGFVDSQTSRSLNSFLSLVDTELQSSRLQTKNS